MAEKIIEQNIVDAYKTNMQTYAIALNRQQAVPEVRDGMKTVLRRIIDMMFEKRYSHNKGYTKCAKVVGDVMGSRHPHGQDSIYDVIVNNANWYATKVPLIDGHGNFGNMQGKDAAAMRYTECRLSEFADECVVGDLYNSKDIVDWVDNYNNTELEPEYLPVKVPLLLINGAFGMGIGMKVDISTHNINEVIDATINLINKIPGLIKWWYAAISVHITITSIICSKSKSGIPIILLHKPLKYLRPSCYILPCIKRIRNTIAFTCSRHKLHNSKSTST